MSDFIAMLDRAAGAAVCNFLNNGGNAALAPMVVGGFMVPGGQVPSAAAGLGLLALNAGCAFDPGQGGPPDTDYSPPGCWKTAGDSLIFGYGPSDGIVMQDFQEFISAIDTGVSGGFGTTYWSFRGRKSDGTEVGNYLPRSKEEVGRMQLFVKPGGTCVQDGPPGWNDPGTFTYVDQSTSCSIDVDFQAWFLDDTGSLSPVLKMSPTPAPGARTSGGIISGCNFTPVVYVGPPGGGGGGGGGGGDQPWVFPWDDDGQPGPGGEPWWLPILKTAVGSALGNLLAGALRDFFGADPASAAARAVAELLVGSDSGMLPAVTYDLTEACPPDGSDPYTHEVPIPGAPALTAIAARCDALEILTQDLKSWKQPTCGAQQPSGELVTVNFISDEPSPGGSKPLRKLLRYRDQTGSPLEAHTAHWEHFTWKAGPVIVASTGSAWGQVQVWAETMEEGKRVIEHAAQIAGVDLAAPQHQWVVTASRDPRLGQTGTMRTARRQNHWVRVSKRPGPSGLPLLAGPLLDP